MLMLELHIELDEPLCLTDKHRIRTVERPLVENHTDGYCPSDLSTIALRIVHQLYCHPSTGSTCDQVSLTNVFQNFTPASLRHSRLTRPLTRWSEVGGLHTAKADLEESVFKPLKFHRIYAKAPIKLPRGILLFGPSGCGKTILASALAEKCYMNFVTCKGPELLDKYIGASEAKVREVFQQAFAASPSLLFFDDFDALAPKRGSDNTGVTDRVVNQLLTFLDGVESFGEEGKGKVFIVAATSRPDKVDAALLRPGRLDRHIYVGFPDTVTEQNDIFCTLARDLRLDTEARQSIENGTFFSDTNSKFSKHLYQKLDLFSPADMKAVLDTAYLEAIHAHLKENEASDVGEMPSITEDHLINALEQTKPSMSSADRSLFDNIYKRFLRNENADRNASSWGKATRGSPNKLETSLR